MNPSPASAERAASRPSATVIVPTRDRPESLARCLSALGRLDYPADRLQIVVVDDGSEPVVDRSAVRAAPAVRWLRQSNRGPAAARNAGLAVATGDIVAFTDDDCEPDPGWLAALADALDRAPDALVGGVTVNALDDNPYSAMSQAIVEGARAWMETNRSDLRFHAANNLAARAQRLRAIDGFDPAFRTAEDRELADRWLRGGGSILTIPGAVVRHRHAMGLTGFWRQHFGYGRGASRLHRARRMRGSGAFRPSVSYCAHALAGPPSAGAGSLGASRYLLLAVWQAANAAGFVSQSLDGWIRGWREHRARAGIDVPRRS